MQNEVDFDEDYTLSPKNFVSTKKVFLRIYSFYSYIWKVIGFNYFSF